MEAAERAFRRAVAIEEYHLRGWLNLGRFYARHRGAEQARSAFRRGAELAVRARGLVPTNDTERELIALGPESFYNEIKRLAELERGERGTPIVTTPARTARAAAVAAAIALLLAAQAALQLDFEQRSPQRRIENLLYLPAGPHLRFMSPGFRTLHADVLWMRAIGYYGTHALTDRSYPWLFHILDQLTTLDPPFRYPYYFGGITLAVSAEHGVDLFSTPLTAVYTRTITAPRAGLRATGRFGATSFTVVGTRDEGGGLVILSGPQGSATRPRTSSLTSASPASAAISAGRS